MSIHVTRSAMPPLEEYINEIKDLWDSQWITNNGKKHKQLEDDLNSYLNTTNLSLFSNGHQSLEAIIKILNLSGEVITTPFTFVSTTHAIVRNGLKPVFCDIKSDDYTIDAENLESLITEKTSAIIPVHVYGNICDVATIDKIAKKYNLKVVYDAAHAFGEVLDGIGIGNFGNASMFSFHATKVFHTIEGGAVTYNDPNLKGKLESYKNFGITSQESVDSIGTNAKMNEFQAAMGICNLRDIENNIQKRKLIAERYVENLQDLKGIQLNQFNKKLKSNYAYFPILFDDRYKFSRDQIADKLAEHNIYARKYFYPLTSNLNCYDFNTVETPIAKYVSDRILTLPIHQDLSLEEVDYICKIIKS